MTCTSQCAKNTFTSKNTKNLKISLVVMLKIVSMHVIIVLSNFAKSFLTNN